MVQPNPTPVYRIVHIDNLDTLLARNALHSPNHTPNDGRVYRTIHDVGIQSVRSERQIGCGPRGVIHDYVPFYFGPRSPMLLQLHTGRVPGYSERQDPLIYLVSSVQSFYSRKLPFVFSDGHGIKAFTKWFDSLDHLSRVDWEAVYAERWNDTIEDMDRQRRKQAEFLVHRSCPWEVIETIGVLDQAIEKNVKSILRSHPHELTRPVEIKPDWYY